MSRTIYVYGLIGRNVAVKGIRYIGITDNPEYRLSSHRKASETTDKAAWVSDLALSGDTVDMIILDQAETRDEARRLEASWIKFAEEHGWELTNTIRPTCEQLALPDAEWQSPMPTLSLDLAERILDANSKMQDELFNLRNELLATQGHISRAPETPKLYNRNALVGAYRQCMIGAIALIVANLLSAFTNVAGVELGFFVNSFLVVAILMAIYPVLFIAGHLVLWLFGRVDVGSPIP